MISIKNLSKQFGSLQVLKDISIEIEQGDIFGIIGQSGAGKSTLLRCINGLESYNSGSLQVDGKEIASLQGRELQKMQKEMGMIFQNFNLLNRLDVYDNIALPLKFWKQNPKSEENRRRIQELLKLVGLEEKIHSRPRQLSGGQKQRVAIARALVMNPRILLCDEATSALDPMITKDILELLLKINREMKITIVIVTHQMEVVKQVCNRVAFIKQGVNIANGRPEDLFISPNREIQEFTGEVLDNLPDTGINIRLFFNNSKDAEDNVITRMARELDVDFSICHGKLENFRGTMMGSLTINVDEEKRKSVTEYLTQKRILWEVLS